MVTKKEFETWLNEREVLHEWLHELNEHASWKENYDDNAGVSRDTIDIILVWRITRVGVEVRAITDLAWEEEFDRIN